MWYMYAYAHIHILGKKPIKKPTAGQQDGSVGKETCNQGWQPDSNPWKPYGKKQEGTFKSVPLTSCIMANKHAFIK